VVPVSPGQTADAPSATPVRRSLRDAVGAVPAAVVLAGVVAASAFVRYQLARGDAAPWIFPDEWIYANLARSLADSHEFKVWSVDWPVHTFGPLYPLLLSSAYSVTNDPTQAYALIKAVNAVAMSLAAVPAYLLARHLVARQLAFFVAGLSVLLPGMVYTSKVMTESIAYPIFLVAVLTMVRTLESASAGRQVVALAMIVVAFFARAEMVVLLPAYVGALIVISLLEGSKQGERVPSRAGFHGLGAYRVTWALLTAGGCALATAGFLSGLSLLGAHEQLLHAVHLQAAPKWVLYQFAELDLAIGAIPVAAFIVVAVRVLTREDAPRGARIYVVLSACLLLAFTTLAAVYATQLRPHPHVFERYSFYAMPLLFVGFAYWLQEGLPRAGRWTLVAAIFSAVLPLALPYQALLDGREWGVSSSTPGLVVWGLVRFWTGTGVGLLLTIFVVTGLMAALFAVAGRSSGPRVAAAVTTYLVVSALVVAVVDRFVAGTAATFGNVATPAWIDRAVGSDARVAALWWGRDSDPNGMYGLLEDQFNNRAVDEVFDLREPMKPGLPSHALELAGTTLVYATGPQAGRPVTEQYVLTKPSVGVAATPIAVNPDNHLVLYRVNGSVRLTSTGARRLIRGE
jgi:hypothetical protein